MITCKFCDKKSEPNYLYLSCKHLSCLSCAFLRTDFSTKELECCQTFTILQQAAIENIIKSKRNFRQESRNTSNKNEKTEGKIEKSKNNPERKQRESHQSNNMREVEGCKSFSSDSLINQAPKILKRGFEECLFKSEQQQNENHKFENILKLQINKVKKGYDTQRQLLKEEEDKRIKNLILAYQEEIKNVEKDAPISQAKLEKFNLSLTKRSSATHRRQQGLEESRIETNYDVNASTSGSNYNNILKRLQTNQQRIKQRIQKHLGDLY